MFVELLEAFIQDMSSYFTTTNYLSSENGGAYPGHTSSTSGVTGYGGARIDYGGSSTPPAGTGYPNFPPYERLDNIRSLASQATAAEYYDNIERYGPSSASAKYNSKYEAQNLSSTNRSPVAPGAGAARSGSSSTGSGHLSSSPGSPDYTTNCGKVPSSASIPTSQNNNNKSTTTLSSPSSANGTSVDPPSSGGGVGDGEEKCLLDAKKEKPCPPGSPGNGDVSEDLDSNFADADKDGDGKQGSLPIYPWMRSQFGKFFLPTL